MKRTHLHLFGGDGEEEEWKRVPGWKLSALGQTPEDFRISLADNQLQLHILTIIPSSTVQHTQHKLSSHVAPSRPPYMPRQLLNTMSPPTALGIRRSP